jgi:membrane protein DedA with SNARE-associated domain
MSFINLDLLWNLGPTSIMFLLTLFSFTNGIILLPASQVILIFGGLLVGKSDFNFLYIFIVLTLSNFLGNYLLYVIAYKWGEETARKILPIKKSTLDKNLLIVNYLFKHHGRLILFVGRNLPVLHSIISIPAGVAKVPKRTYTIYTLLGMALWSLIFMGIGMYFGTNYEYFADRFELVVVSLTAIILGGTYLFYKTYLDKVLIKTQAEEK